MKDLVITLEKLGLHICTECGCTLLYHKDEERPSEPERIHEDWHRLLRERVEQE